MSEQGSNGFPRECRSWRRLKRRSGLVIVGASKLCFRVAVDFEDVELEVGPEWLISQDLDEGLNDCQWAIGVASNSDGFWSRAFGVLDRYKTPDRLIFIDPGLV